MEYDRIMMRLAGRIRQIVDRQQSEPARALRGEMDDLEYRYGKLQHHRRTLSMAAQKGFSSSSKRTLSGIAMDLQNLWSSVASCQRLCEQAQESSKPAGLREIYLDLMAAKAEFGMTWDHKDKELVVTTDAITLEDTYLGDFEVRVRLDQIIADQCFVRVVAMDPHPAASDHRVTHPHVSDEGLCMGDGKTAIKKALRSGRIFDAFELMNSILTTYNSGSPYISLSDWDGSGTICHDCEASLDEDESYNCHTCGDDYCGECSYTCRSCDDTVCANCSTRCPVCDDRVCDRSRCLPTCGDCGEQMCTSCLESHDCQVETEEEETADQPAQESTASM